MHDIRATISSQICMRATNKISISLKLPPPSSSSKNHQKSAKSVKISNSAHPAAFPGASQQPPSAASSSSLPRGQPAFPGVSQQFPRCQPAFPGASQQSSRGHPAVSQSTSQNGIIHTHLDHVNMSQCTFSFYVICYLYWFGCVSFFSAVSFTFQLE